MKIKDRQLFVDKLKLEKYAVDCGRGLFNVEKAILREFYQDSDIMFRNSLWRKVKENFITSPYPIGPYIFDFVLPESRQLRRRDID